MGAEGLATALAFARFALRLSLPLAVGALTRTALRKRRSLPFFLFAVRSPNKFVIVPQKKEDVNATSLASFVLVGAEGFEPPTLCL